MKKYKKIAAALLSGTMALSLAACGGNESESSGSSGGSSKKVELKMIFWDSNQEPGLQAMADGFMEKNPDISVTVETIPWDDYWTKLQAAAQGGDMPDTGDQNALLLVMLMLAAAGLSAGGFTYWMRRRAR